MAPRLVNVATDAGGAVPSVGSALRASVWFHILILVSLPAFVGCSSEHSAAYGDVLLSRGSNVAGATISRGADLRTDPDGLLRVALPGLDLRIDGGSDVHVGDAASARLWRGRVRISPNGEGTAWRLLTPFGEVSPAEGAVPSFVAWATKERLLVTCLDGDVVMASLGHREEVRVPRGRTGIATTGCLAVPRRDSPWAASAEWTHRFDDVARRTTRAIAAVPRPMAVEPPTMPTGLVVESMTHDVRARGPLVLVRTDVRIRNSAEVAVEVALDPAAIVAPAPLLGGGAQRCAVPAGETTRMTFETVSAMAPAGDRYGFAVCPGAWTFARLGELSVRIDARARGGISAFESDVVGLRVAPAGDSVTAAWDTTDVTVTSPLVFAVAFGEDAGTEVLEPDPETLPGAGGRTLLAAWDAGRPEADVLPGARVMVALDAAADWGASGVDWACALAEAMIDELLPHRFAGLLLFDGQGTTFLPYPGPPELEGVARDARAALWSVEPVRGETGAPDFVESALGAAPAGDAGDLLLLLTGETPVESELPAGIGKVLLVRACDPALRDVDGAERRPAGADVACVSRFSEPLTLAKALVDNLPWCGAEPRRLPGHEVARRSTLGNEPRVAFLASGEEPPGGKGWP